MPARRSPMCCRWCSIRRPAAQEPALAHLKVHADARGERQAVTQIADNEAASAETVEFPQDARTGRHRRSTASNRQAGRDDAADRHRRIATRAAGARVSAIRSRQGARVHPAGFVAVADARARSPSRIRRTKTSGASSCAGWSTACRTRSKSQSTTDRVEPAESATLPREIVDSTFVELNDAAVVAHVTAPTAASPMCRCSGAASGAASIRPLVPTGAQGWYEAQNRGHRGGKTIGTRDHASARRAWRRRVLRRHDARRHAAPHRGRNGRPLLHADTVQGLAEDLRYTGRGVTTRRRARSVASADRARAAHRLAVRGVGLSACGWPVLASSSRQRSRPVWPRPRRAGWLVARRGRAAPAARSGSDARVAVRRTLRLRAAALFAAPRAATGASRPGRTTTRARIGTSAHSRGDHAAQAASSTRATSSRSTIRSCSTIRSPTCLSPASGR